MPEHTPITGILFDDCCARAASGHAAAAPPRSVMNCRRLISSPPGYTLPRSRIDQGGGNRCSGIGGNHNADHRKRTGIVAVDEVHFHRKASPADEMLAGAMKVEL